MHLASLGRRYRPVTGLFSRPGPRRRVLALAAVCIAAVFILAGSSVAWAGPGTIIAWVPSHQDDTGATGWHEYQVCGDITQRTMALLASDYTNVLCWETGLGLTSSNYPAIQSEIDKATAAHAQILISVHVNANSPSGFIGCYYPGDSSSSRYEDTLLASMALSTGMSYNNLSARSDLYILDPANDPIPIRVILELGDSAADRDLLLSESGRQMLAEALAKAVREHTPPPQSYEEDSPLLSYAGTWVDFAASGSSAGKYRYADSAATATIYFDGTRLDWIATKGVTMGQATVSLDGAKPVIVDLYNSTVLRQQKAWSTGDVLAGSHKVVVTWTGKPSVAGGGTRVNIDALDVWGKLTQAPGPPPPAPVPARFEQTDLKIGYTGTWIEFAATGASAGTYRYADSAATATIYFDGTRLDWIATKGVTMGRATVSLDGGQPQTVELYSPSVQRQKKVWSTGPVASGAHKMVITWAGKPSVAGGGTRVNIDALDIMGVLTQAPVPKRYEQGDGRIAYAGKWIEFAAIGASAGTYRYADSAATATISFDGTRLDWIATKGLTMGRATVSLDGAKPVLVDLYYSSTQRQKLAWSTGTLSAGSHKLTITWTGQRSVTGGGTRVNIDALDVTGTLTQASS